MSLTIGDQNSIKSCRWSSNFYLSAVLSYVKDQPERRAELAALGFVWDDFEWR